MRAIFWVTVLILLTLWVMFGIDTLRKPPPPPVPAAPRPLFIWTAPMPVV